MGTRTREQDMQHDKLQEVNVLLETAARWSNLKYYSLASKCVTEANTLENQLKSQILTDWQWLQAQELKNDHMT